jgi:hypothetical protein
MRERVPVFDFFQGGAKNMRAHWYVMENGKVKCGLCVRRCAIPKDGVGFCGDRHGIHQYDAQCDGDVVEQQTKRIFNFVQGGVEP